MAWCGCDNRRISTDIKDLVLKKISVLQTNLPDKNSSLEAVWLFILALLIRLSYVTYVYMTDLSRHFTDDVFYRKMALDIVKQGRILYDLAAVDVRYDWLGPVLPWINAITAWVFGGDWLGFFIITSIASALITFYIYRLTLLVSSRRAAQIAGIVSAGYFYFIMFSAGVGKDIWMILALVATTYFLLRAFIPSDQKTIEHTTRIDYQALGWFALIHILSLHLDERFAALSPLFLLFILFSGGLMTAKFRIKPFLVTGAIMLALMTPWQIRNFQRYGKVVILTKRTEHITDRVFGYKQEHYELDRVMDFYQSLVISPAQVDSFVNGSKMLTDGGFEISKPQLKAMRNGIVPHAYSSREALYSRFKIMLQLWQKNGEYTVNGFYYYERSLMNNLVSLFFYGFALLFGVIGLLILHKDSASFWLFLMIIIVYLGLHVLMVPYTVWRYRLPIDSLLLVGVGIALDAMMSKLARLSRV
jgi:hypothetical protein